MQRKQYRSLLQREELIMMMTVFGLIIFLFILANVIKYGNPNQEVQKKHWKRWIDEVTFDINKLTK